jgi:hypothetical protein
MKLCRQKSLDHMHYDHFNHMHLKSGTQGERCTVI